MKSVSHMSAPLGRFPPLTVKEFQVATATPGAKETAGPLTWAQLMEITLEPETDDPGLGMGRDPGSLSLTVKRSIPQPLGADLWHPPNLFQKFPVSQQGAGAFGWHQCGPEPALAGSRGSAQGPGGGGLRQGEMPQPGVGREGNMTLFSMFFGRRIQLYLIATNLMKQYCASI